MFGIHDKRNPSDTCGPDVGQIVVTMLVCKNKCVQKQLIFILCDKLTHTDLHKFAQVNLSAS